MVQTLTRTAVTLAVLAIAVVGLPMPAAAVPLDGDDGDVAVMPGDNVQAPGQVGVMPGDNPQIPDGTFLKAKKAFDENVPKTSAWTARDRLFTE
ncbi:hypothetical protein [Haloarcula pellucida]|uniref:Uncharacterized protein n=1 Tax=Haloarcula pellucida TaxID=1427151 RepID=A0A830GNT0_9EURY|nr:hypothetical protein [Halomicroarcula pellucida]MBX0348107.1 hypothetical protein [Halomicroarcula pellucida]GGN96959.1 hypothetical protein GCM10009030_25800 [Halomicroarcula pellucida]